MQRGKHEQEKTNRKYAKRNCEPSSEDSVSSRTALVSLVSRAPLGRSSSGAPWAPDSHQLRPEAVDDGTQGQAAPPGGGQVGDVDVLVALGLLLAPV